MNSKKVFGIAVSKDSTGTMIGRIINGDERDHLLTYFPEKFVKPEPYGANYTIGKVQSESGIGFRELPGEAIFGVILTCPDNDCEFRVYADKEPDEIQDVLNVLGGLSTFKEIFEKTGNTYAIGYTGGSGMWEMICLPPNK